MRSYTCSCCGETHEGISDIAFDAPIYYHAIPLSEREQRCHLSSDLCSIDDRDFFIRGVVEIPIVGEPEVFAWGAWCSVSKSNFDLYVEMFDAPDQSKAGPFFGWFSNRLPGYPDTLNLKVMAHLRDEGARPRFELESTHHPLSVDQREGISSARLRQIHQESLHPPDADT